MKASLAWVSALVAFVAVLASSSSAQAYPWMIRHGFAECGSCHVDPMGGETLTGMGRMMGESVLPTGWSDSAPSQLGAFLFGVPEPESVHLGGSVRVMSVANFDTGWITTFPMQADLYGAGTVGKFTAALSLGVSRASRRYEHSSKARVLGNIEDEGPLLVSRNYWVGYHLDQRLMIRAGRLNLPFGIRGPEHTLWTRAETLTDRESDQQHGVSVVYAGGRVRGELLGSLGNFQISPDAIRERGYSAYVEYLLEPELALGVSSLVLAAARERAIDEGPVVRQAHGLTARYVPWQPLVLLAEADVLKKTGAGVGYVGMATLDYEPWRGLHLAPTLELLNAGKPPDGALVGRGKTRFGSWLTANWFFGPHFDVRVDLVLRQNRANVLQTQLHFYL